MITTKKLLNMESNRLKHDASLDYAIPPSSVVLVVQALRTISGIHVKDGSLDYAPSEIIPEPVVSDRLPYVPKGIIYDASFDYR